MTNTTAYRDLIDTMEAHIELLERDGPDQDPFSEPSPFVAEYAKGSLRTKEKALHHAINQGDERAIHQAGADLAVMARTLPDAPIHAEGVGSGVSLGLSIHQATLAVGEYSLDMVYDLNIKMAQHDLGVPSTVVSVEVEETARSYTEYDFPKKREAPSAPDDAGAPNNVNVAPVGDTPTLGG